MAKRNTPSLIDVAYEFGKIEQCLAYLEAMRWPEGVRCVKCQHDKVSKFIVAETVIERKNRKTGEMENRTVPMRYLYQCLNTECKQQFSATSGTIFHDSHLPLPKWFMAVALVVNAKKGISAKQLQRDLDVNYRTAWYLYHRVREAMQEPGGIFTGTVEADATFVGGRYDERRKRAKYGKQPVFGLLQRGTDGKVSRVQVQTVKSEIVSQVAPIIKRHVAQEAKFYTDDHASYKTVGKTRNHQIVIHSKGEYVRGDIHSNGIESFWSLFKRGVIRQYHQISVKHLSRYLNEFQFRFNNRDAEDLFALVLLNLVIGEALTYAGLTSTSGPAMPSTSPLEDRKSDEKKALLDGFNSESIN